MFCFLFSLSFLFRRTASFFFLQITRRPRASEEKRSTSPCAARSVASSVHKRLGDGGRVKVLCAAAFALWQDAKVVRHA